MTGLGSADGDSGIADRLAQLLLGDVGSSTVSGQQISHGPPQQGEIVDVRSHGTPPADVAGPAPV
jgi:hypothetical protein